MRKKYKKSTAWDGGIVCDECGRQIESGCDGCHQEIVDGESIYCVECYTGTMKDGFKTVMGREHLCLRCYNGRDDRS